MSCRHDLANGTCTRCYPERPNHIRLASRITPGPESEYEPNLDGPGAVPAEMPAQAKIRERVEHAIYEGVRSGVFMLEDMDDEQAAEYELAVDAVVTAAAGAAPLSNDAAKYREESIRQGHQIRALTEKIAKLEDPALMMQWRGVEDPCPRCRGSGVKTYGSTATWRGGMGGALMTRDVCDACWGSGDKFRTGADLRRLRADEDKRVAEAAVDLIARTVGSAFPGCTGAIAHIVIALDKVADKRGAPAAPYLPEIAVSLGNVLRRAIGARERK